MPSTRYTLPAALILAALASARGAWLREANSLHSADDFYVGMEGVCGAQCIERLLESDALSSETCEGVHLGATPENDLSWVKLRCTVGSVRQEELHASLRGLRVEHPHPNGGVLEAKVWAVHD